MNDTEYAIHLHRANRKIETYLHPVVALGQALDCCLMGWAGTVNTIFLLFHAITVTIRTLSAGGV